MHSLSSEIQQILAVHGVNPTAGSLATFIEVYLKTLLANLINSLNFITQRLRIASGKAASDPARLLLLSQLGNQSRYDRLQDYLDHRDDRRAAKEALACTDEPEETLGAAADEEQQAMFDNDPMIEFVLGAEYETDKPDGPAVLDIDSIFDTPLHVSKSHQSTNSAWKRHLADHDRAASTMSRQSYKQFCEARHQASFVHTNAGLQSPFGTYTSELLKASDLPASQDLLEGLGFIAHDICNELIERSKKLAQSRLAEQHAMNTRLKQKREARLQLQRKQKRKAARENKVVTTSTTKRTKQEMAKRAAAEAESERLRRQAQHNLLPAGPFSGPLESENGQEHQDDSLPSHLTGESALATAGVAVSAGATKLDNPTVGADVSSRLDLQVGDLQNAAYQLARSSPGERLIIASASRSGLR